MSDDFRDEKGRLKPGAPPLYKGKQAQPDTQSDTPPFDGDFDDAIIFIAETYSGKPRVFVGLLAVCEDLRRNKSTEFASYLRQAYANRQQKRQDNTISPGVHVSFVTAPSGMCVDANGKLIPASDAREAWEKRAGMTLTSNEPPPEPPPAQQVLVQPRDDEDEPPPPKPSKPLALMSGPELAAALDAGQVEFETPQQAEPRDEDAGISMNEMWRRATPKPKWTKPRDGW